MTPSSADQRHADREATARRHLLGAGAGALPRMPWQRGRQPPPATTLVQFALLPANNGDEAEANLRAALVLLPAARAELDQLEAGLLFEARSRGLSWSTIADALGLRSAQAAQQRLDRVSSRVENQGTA